MNVLLKLACETDCRQLSTETNSVVCIMSHRKSSVNVKVTTTCFHLHYTAVYNSGSHTEFKGILSDWDANLQMRWLIKGDGRRILWSLARAAFITQVYAANDFRYCRFFSVKSNNKTNSQIKYWSWKYLRLILQDQDWDHKYQDEDRVLSRPRPRSWGLHPWD